MNGCWRGWARMFYKGNGHWLSIKTRRIKRAFAGMGRLEKHTWSMCKGRVCYKMREGMRYICIAWALGLGYTTWTDLLLKSF